MSFFQTNKIFNRCGNICLNHDKDLPKAQARIKANLSDAMLDPVLPQVGVDGHDGQAVLERPNR